MIQSDEYNRDADYWDYYYEHITHKYMDIQMQAVARLREFAFLNSANESRAMFNTRTCILSPSNAAHGYLWWIMKGQAIKEKRSYMNFYISVARYKNGIPSIPWGEKRKEAKQKWIEECDSKIIDYPFLIDLDLESHDDVYLGLEDVKKILIKMIEEKGWYNITVTFSGMGFHILVPMEIVTQNRNFNNHVLKKDGLHVLPENTIYEEYKNIAERFYNDCSNKIDLNIYDHARLMKAPYSVACYQNAAYIAHPFGSIPELLDFSLPYLEIRQYKSYPNNLFKKISKGVFGIPICVKKWQDENERAQLLKKLKIE